MDIHHAGQVVEATIHWRTGQSQVIEIRRTQAKGNLESRWTKEELDILKRLWPSTSQDALLTSLPGRTWKAITHQARNQRLRRDHSINKRTLRRRWDVEEESKARTYYEAGAPMTDVADMLGRSHSAVMQRAWGKGWPRSVSTRRGAISGKWSEIQNPEVPNGITSGLLFGGQARGNNGQLVSSIWMGLTYWDRCFSPMFRRNDILTIKG